VPRVLGQSFVKYQKYVLCKEEKPGERKIPQHNRRDHPKKEMVINRIKCSPDVNPEKIRTKKCLLDLMMAFSTYSSPIRALGISENRRSRKATLLLSLPPAHSP
jgi:hypothetical protein